MPVFQSFPTNRSCPSGVTAACFADPCTVLPPDCPWATAPAGAATAGAAAGTAGSAPATAASGFTCEASYCDKGVLPDGSVVGRVPPAVCV